MNSKFGVMILLIDNYDSFTWNLVHLIGSLGYEVEVERNDSLSVDEAIQMKAQAIVLSPGPCTPDQAGISLDMVRMCNKKNIPLFGVCLGLQSIAQAFGGRVVRAQKLMHGKVSEINRIDDGFMNPLPDNFTATRYHSLVADEKTLPDCFAVTSRSADDGEIMSIEHKNKPIAGVQFHPESIASQHGDQLFEAFITWADNFNGAP